LTVAAVQFKFRDDTSHDERDQLIAKLHDGGAEKVERAFPDADDELATLYTALIDDDELSSKLLRILRRSRKVEFAEAQSDRRLILPVELKDRPSDTGSRRSGRIKRVS
jgi:hypothetical protein